MNGKTSEYVTLVTKPINIYNTHVIVTEDKIMDILETCYKNTAFSTFPYLYNGLNSEEAITQTKSGNCIALSLYVKKHLKKKYDINSCLIPATIPKKYQRDGYLDISHVALLIPIDNSSDDNGVFIADPAFYFLNPIEIKNFNPRVVFSKNIYTPETNNNIEDFVSISKLITKLYLYDKDQHFNEWQTIKKGTYYVNCFEMNDPHDSWNYFLTEIQNPDEAITGFFLDQQDPFITTIDADKYGLPQMGGYLKIKNSVLTYSKNLKTPQTYNIKNIDDRTLKEINNDLYPFFRGNLSKYLK